jgi:hypothetical protein
MAELEAVEVRENGGVRSRGPVFQCSQLQSTRPGVAEEVFNHGGTAKISLFSFVLERFSDLLQR